MTEGFERFPHPAQRSGVGFTRAGAYIFDVVLVLIGCVSLAQQLQDGSTLRAILSVNVCGVLAMFAFGIAPQRTPKRSFRFLNSVVLTRAEQRPADSWVHVAPTRALRLPLTIGIVWATIGLIAALIAALLQLIGVTPVLNTDTGKGGLILGSIVLVPLTLGGAYLSWLLVWRRIRNGSFGTRPSGVTLGSSGIAVRVPGRDVELTWGQILSATPEVISRASSQQSISMITLKLAGGSGIAGDVQRLSAEGYQVPGDALYTALRWYHAHPDKRWELGRIEGQQRLEGWRLDAIGAVVRRPGTV